MKTEPRCRQHPNAAPLVARLAATGEMAYVCQICALILGPAPEDSEAATADLEAAGGTVDVETVDVVRIQTIEGEDE